MKTSSKRAVLFLGPVLAAVLILVWDFARNHAGQAGWALPTGKGAAAVAIGGDHGVILASDGSLWTWGGSGSGWQVLGLGSNIRTQACLRRIGVETNWVNIAVGGSTTLALKSDGAIWAWGENIYGQLGDGTLARQRAAPVRSVPGEEWKQVATAGPHSVALKRDGTLWSSGNNWAGQLGDGTTTYSRTPVRVGSSTNWTRVWANLIQNVGQQTDGSLWFWGWDYTRPPRGSSIPVPTRVSPDTNWVDVGMGDSMVFAIKSDGTLWAWGNEAELFTGATNAKANSSPLRVGADTDWRACAPFSQKRPALLKRDGSLWVFEGSDQPRVTGVTGRGGVAEVTTVLAGWVTNNQLTCRAGGPGLGDDPAFGIVKRLQITFQVGAATQTLAFRENSTVSLGRAGEPLTIIRALYGDPSIISHGPAPSLRVVTFEPPRPRRIELQKGVVAFATGRHGLGVALSADGQVWTWGEALGRETPAIRWLQLLSQGLNRVGIGVQWGNPGPVIFKEPTRLEIATPGAHP
jgi:alpha-tubulin suppressor-like RCC1 family protein